MMPARLIHKGKLTPHYKGLNKDKENFYSEQRHPQDSGWRIREWLVYDLVDIIHTYIHIYIYVYIWE